MKSGELQNSGHYFSTPNILTKNFSDCQLSNEFNSDKKSLEIKKNARKNLINSKNIFNPINKISTNIPNFFNKKTENENSNIILNESPLVSERDSYIKIDFKHKEFLKYDTDE